jgi:ABC-type molybdenum transport system ATPase subunit/photorepair protein PhrA
MRHFQLNAGERSASLGLNGSGKHDARRLITGEE